MRKHLLVHAATIALLSGAASLEAVDVFGEVKAAYFYPISERFRDVYGSGGIYGAEGTCQIWKPLYGWASVDYFHKSGQSTGAAGGDPTKVRLIPLAFGLKYLIPYKKVDFYLGLGPTFTHIHFKDNSPFVIKNSSKWGYGVIAKAGALINFREHFFIDLFTSYSYLKTRFSNTNGGQVQRPRMDLSDWSIGAGLGVRWGRPKKQS